MSASNRSISERRQGLSWWHLCLFFVLAVALFVLLRWQPDAWLQEQIDNQAYQHGMVVQYQRLHVDGFTLHLEHLSIRSARWPAPMMIDTLTLTPAWSSLLKARAAIHLLANSNGQRLETLLIWQSGHIGISGLQGDLDVALLQPFWQRRLTLPIYVGGRLILAGDMLLDAASGMPVDGNIKLEWHSAATDVTGLDKPLGDYRLLLKAGKASGKLSGKASGKSWQWTLTGGSSLKLSGQGTIHIAGPLLQQWGIHGRIRLQPMRRDNAIAAMLGGKVAAFSLSGNVINPRWQALVVGH